MNRRSWLALAGMSLPAVMKSLDAVTKRVQVGKVEDSGVLRTLARNPSFTMEASGMEPDPWQSEILRKRWKRLLLCCSRQSGKSQIAASLALNEALLRPPSLIIVLSPSQRQSGELFREKLIPMYDALGCPVPTTQRSALSMRLANGSRIVTLPGRKDGTVRGYSGAALIIIDEASQVGDELYRAVRPMLAVSGGRLMALSTPKGKRGWFFENWFSIKESNQASPAMDEDGCLKIKDNWDRVLVRAHQCKRISEAFLREERTEQGERWYLQEYCCSFSDLVGAMYSWEDIQACMDDEAQPLFVQSMTDADESEFV
jgi:hypothetical protein